MKNPCADVSSYTYTAPAPVFVPGAPTRSSSPARGERDRLAEQVPVGAGSCCAESCAPLGRYVNAAPGRVAQVDAERVDVVPGTAWATMHVAAARLLVQWRSKVVVLTEVYLPPRYIPPARMH